METPEKKRRAEDNGSGLGTPETLKGSASASGSDDLEHQSSRKKKIIDDDDDDDDEESKPTRIWMFFCVLVLVVAGATAFVVMFLLNKDDMMSSSDPQDVVSNPDEVGAPTSMDDDIFAPIMPVAPTGPVAPIAPVVKPTGMPSPHPTPVPTKFPTKSPTKIPTTTGPTTSPTASPVTPSPTPAPTTLAPTRFPTETPSVTIDGQAEIIDQLTNAAIVVDTTADPIAAAAIDWLAQEFSTLDETLIGQYYLHLPQRYAVLSLELRLFSGESIASDQANRRRRRLAMPSATPLIHVCFWEGITCIGTSVQRIEWGNRGYEDATFVGGGSIGTEIGTLIDLEYLDLHSNGMIGVIPEQLYTLPNLSQVFLYKNDLTGTISTRIGNLWNLQTWHTSHNRLSGSIPPQIRSGETIRPLHYLNLYNNQMTGTLPERLRLRQLFHLDLGRNQFSGPLPEDFPDKAAALRLFHIDHNKFSGQIPALYSQAGNGRVVSFAIDNNEFTGTPPVEDMLLDNVLVSYTMHNNQFTVELDKDFCKQNVFEGGEMVEMKADCEICSCKDDFCDNCF